MFGLGGGELIIVLILAVLLIGPKDLPKVANQIGRWIHQFRIATQDFKSTVEKELDLSDTHSSNKDKPSQN